MLPAFYRTWHDYPQTFVSEDEEGQEPEEQIEDDGFVDIIVTGEVSKATILRDPSPEYAESDDVVCRPLNHMQAFAGLP